MAKKSKTVDEAMETGDINLIVQALEIDPGNVDCFINFFDPFAPLAERIVFIESGVSGPELCPFFEQFRPLLKIVAPEFFEGCVLAELRRKVAVVIAHQAHAQPQEAPNPFVSFVFVNQ